MVPIEEDSALSYLEMVPNALSDAHHKPVVFRTLLEYLVSKVVEGHADSQMLVCPVSVLQLVPVKEQLLIKDMHSTTVIHALLPVL
jgi:hypothetical protein